MSSCDPERLSAYLDRDLSLPARVRLEEHVRECQSCARELDALRRVDELLALWGARRAPIPAMTESRINTSVSKRRRLGRVLALSRMMPAALGSTVAAFLVVVSVNTGVLFSNPTVTGSPVASQTTLVIKRSLPFVNARRTTAIFGTRVTTQPTVIGRTKSLSVTV